LGVAVDRRIRLVSGPAKSLEYAVYAANTEKDLAHLIARLDQAKIQREGSDIAGLKRGAVRFADPDGNSFAFGVADQLASPGTADGVPMSARIQHIVFASTNIQRMIDFFVDVIGFQLSDRVLDSSGGLKTAFLRCSEEHHSLAIFAASENRLDHHCYESRNWNEIRDWADHLAKLRIPLKWGPGRHGPGDNLFIFVHDPDGNWVEISAELEIVQADRAIGEWPHEERTLNSWGAAPLRS